MEILLTTEADNQTHNVAVWNATTGEPVTTLKGGVTSAPRTLGLVHNGDYVISADSAKPLINVWSMSSQNHPRTQMVCTGLVTAMTVSKDGMYCVAGIDSKLHIWQTSSGNLLRILSGHCMKISCIRFTDDLSFLISASEDGQVFVWFFPSVIQMSVYGVQSAPTVEPLHTLSHSGAVTDVHVGMGGAAARVVTASSDKTVKYWQLANGKLLETFTFDAAISSVCMDESDQFICAGSTEGNIYITKFMKKSGTSIRSSESDVSYQSEQSTLRGHGASVTCMTISTTISPTLVSGSADCTVILWNIILKQQIRKISHKGAITNCLLTHSLIGLSNEGQYTTLPLPIFQRNLVTDSSSTDESKPLYIRLRNNEHIVKKQQEWEDEEMNEAIEYSEHKYGYSQSEEDQTTETSLRRQIDELRKSNASLQKANKDLYKFAVDKILDERS